MTRDLAPALVATRVTRGFPWRPPTRRTFLAMLGLGGAALALRTTRGRDVAVLDPPRQTWTGTTRWIGHG